MARIDNGRRHTRGDVAAAALQILEEYGLPDLTMRRLASVLDVQPSALYWHFPNKQSLLAELAERIVTRAEGFRGMSNSTSHTRSETAALRDALLAYRDGAEVVSSTLALGLGSSTARDRLASAIRADGFGDATRAASALLHFVIGHVFHEQQRTQFDSLGVVAPEVSVSADALEGESSDFTFGVDLFIGGLELRRIPALPKQL
jgi:AcrR family transcriptional regulator